MTKFYIEESGSYKIRMEIIAEDENDAVDVLYSYLPSFIDVESEDREVTKVEEWNEPRKNI